MRGLTMPIGGVLLTLALGAPAPGTALRGDPVTIINPAHPHGGAQVRPSRVAIDNHNLLFNLRWRDWGSRVARATGRASINTCIPNCAQGGGETFQVNVRATAVRSCTVDTLDPPVTARFYNSVTFRFRGRPPGPPKHRIRWPKLKRLPPPCP